jgi:hypothetical protein
MLLPDESLELTLSEDEPEFELLELELLEELELPDPLLLVREPEDLLPLPDVLDPDEPLPEVPELPLRDPDPEPDPPLSEAEPDPDPPLPEGVGVGVGSGVHVGSGVEVGGGVGSGVDVGSGVHVGSGV